MRVFGFPVSFNEFACDDEREVIPPHVEHSTKEYWWTVQMIPYKIERLRRIVTTNSGKKHFFIYIIIDGIIMKKWYWEDETKDWGAIARAWNEQSEREWEEERPTFYHVVDAGKGSYDVNMIRYLGFEISKIGIMTNPVFAFQNGCLKATLDEERACLCKLNMHSGWSYFATQDGKSPALAHLFDSDLSYAAMMSLQRILMEKGYRIRVRSEISE